MSWQLNEQTANFILANEYLDFLEFLRDHVMSSSEYDELWVNFRRWKMLGSPSLNMIYMFHNVTRIKGTSIASIYKIVHIRFQLPIVLSIQQLQSPNH